ncbi:hypothetical protein ACWGRV_40155 [Streptomyces sp. NPDC055663]
MYEVGKGSVWPGSNSRPTRTGCSTTRSKSSSSAPPYSAADLELNWVEDQSYDPFSYGLIDTEGRWRIPMGQRFICVRPFRDGTAEVILNTEDGSVGGPWTGIDTQGRSVDRPS